MPHPTGPWNTASRHYNRGHMRILIWLLRGFFFFALFAFALNNRQEVLVHWFFGHTWQAPLVLVVFAAFAAGCALGLVAMTPSWWRRRTITRRHASADAPMAAAPAPTAEFAATLRHSPTLPPALAESELALAHAPRTAP